MQRVGPQARRITATVPAGKGLACGLDLQGGRALSQNAGGRYDWLADICVQCWAHWDWGLPRRGEG